MAGLGLGGPAPVAAVAAVFALLAATVALPLLVYTTALALFGLAHVLSELRYLDHRFGARLRARLVRGFAALLLATVATRMASLAGAIDPGVGLAIELGCAATLVALAALQAPSCRLLASCGAAPVAFGALLAPFETMLALAIAHNLTPIVLIAETVEDATRRRRVAAALLVPFVLLPALIASGAPWQLLAGAGLVAPEASLFEAGGLAANLGAYVPMALRDSPWAIHLFAAAVFAQCMHYVAVIVVLPRLIEPACRPLLRWPPPGRFAALVALAAAALALAFALDYADSRRLYALAALVHSWAELPVLVIALTGARAQPAASAYEARPTMVDTAFAASDVAAARPIDSGSSAR